MVVHWLVMGKQRYRVGLLFTGGALLEQINYYYTQLMYDNPYDWNYLRTHRRLRQGIIGKALAQEQEQRWQS
jgi:hypothetical protein